ncbi:MAG: aldose 1-epimerase, partial [Pseudomonadota bacterium]|nr:aldose 1-epimerase [Pseudomonadota bacterium]
MTTTLQLCAGPARLTLAPEVGGAIAAYEWNGKSILRPTPGEALAAGDVRLFSSYPLVPFSNRIADATLHWGGTTYPLQRYLAGEAHAIHGNGWRRAWNVVEQAPAHATLEITHDAAGDKAREWPFPYRAQQQFDLAADALTLTLTISNSGDAPFPFGLGWHPYFPRNEATVLGFVAGGVWHTDPTLLPMRLDPIPPAWNFGAPRSIAATTLDNCFTGWRPPATLRWPDGGLSAAITGDEACDHLVVFIPAGGDFLAVEPVTHMT